MPGLSGVLPGMAGRKAAGRRLVQMAHGSVLGTEAGEKHLTSPDSAGYATARGHGAIHMLLERPRSGHLVTPHDSFASMAPFLGGSAIYDPATDCDASSKNQKKKQQQYLFGKGGCHILQSYPEMCGSGPA